MKAGQLIDPAIVASVLLGALIAWLAARHWCRAAVRELAAETVRLRPLVGLLETALERAGTVQVRRDPDGGLVIAIAAPPEQAAGPAATDQGGRPDAEGACRW